MYCILKFAKPFPEIWYREDHNFGPDIKLFLGITENFGFKEIGAVEGGHLRIL